MNLYEKYKRTPSPPIPEPEGALYWRVDPSGVVVYVRRTCGGVNNLVAYVGIPKTHPLSKTPDYDEMSEKIEVHGGFTFGPEVGDESEIWPGDHLIWFGWDYAHAGDLILVIGNASPLPGKMWTVEEVIQEAEACAKTVIEWRGK